MGDLMIVMTLRELCIENDWFNAGTNKQYDKMFDFAKELIRDAADRTMAILRLADIIWVCTDGKTENEIYKGLEPWFDEMRKKARNNVLNVCP